MVSTLRAADITASSSSSLEKIHFGALVAKVTRMSSGCERGRNERGQRKCPARSSSMRWVKAWTHTCCCSSMWDTCAGYWPLTGFTGIFPGSNCSLSNYCLPWPLTLTGWVGASQWPQIWSMTGTNNEHWTGLLQISWRQMKACVSSIYSTSN